jgi:hypothetical protein
LWEDDPEGTVTCEHPAGSCTLLHWGDVGADATALASLGRIDAPEGDPHGA